MASGRKSAARFALFLALGLRALPAEGAQAAESPAALTARAEEALRRADFVAAIDGFEKLVRGQPAVAEFHANLGMAYYSAGRFEDASRECRAALKLKPALAHAHYFLGLSLAGLGRCSQALPILEKDFSRVTDKPLKRLMGTDALRCSMALARSDRAVNLVRALGRDFPDDAEVLYLTSHVYSDLSTRATSHLLETAPGSAPAHRLNAEVLELQGKLSEAVEEYRKVLAADPRTSGVHYNLGRLLLALQNSPAGLEEARREFEEELKVDPWSAQAEYELAELARQARQWGPAVEHFARATRIDPEFVEAWIGLGKSLTSAGHPLDAMPSLAAAVKLDPENPVAHYQLSFAYRRLGRDAEAEKELASYRQAQEKFLRRREIIRAGILGNIASPQTAEPPE